MTAVDTLAPLREFVRGMTRLADTSTEESVLMPGCRQLLGPLLADDRWLPESCAQPHPEHYQQYLLHCDPLERFSVTSFVWGPGQFTPIHDHTVWGLIGILRGAELSERFEREADGRLVSRGASHLSPGAIDPVSPTLGDIHKVSNALADEVSISIHVYGANIGAVRRHVFDPQTGAVKAFVSGYSSALIPNLWDVSALVRQQAG
ncbi:MAG: cysteine dioxygenase [Gammaproteobacteria bacterium]|nr:cysteine dioxygenase [Gammaproteobacteria bacterium]